MALNNVPLAGQTLAATQTPINQNFSTINNAFAIDHTAMTPPGTAAPQGYHKQVSLVVQGTSPSTAWGTTYNGIYSYNPTLTGKNEVYIHGQKASGATEVPMTASILSTTTPSALSAGWTYLPSGMILKWAANITATGQQTINFPTGANIPAFTTCITVIPVIADGGAGDVDCAIRLTGVNPTNFSVYGSPRTTTGAKNVTFTYYAIGY